PSIPASGPPAAPVGNWSVATTVPCSSISAAAILVPPMSTPIASRFAMPLWPLILRVMPDESSRANRARIGEGGRHDLCALGIGWQRPLSNRLPDRVEQQIPGSHHPAADHDPVGIGKV